MIYKYHWFHQHRTEKKFQVDVLPALLLCNPVKIYVVSFISGGIVFR